MRDALHPAFHLQRLLAAVFPLRRRPVDVGRADDVPLLPMSGFFDWNKRGPYRIDDAARVIEYTWLYASALGKTALPVTFQHNPEHYGIDFLKRPAPASEAAGHIVGLSPRFDGLEARITWTRAAHAHFAARECGYLIAVFDADERNAVRKILCAGLGGSSPPFDRVNIPQPTA